MQINIHCYTCNHYDKKQFSIHVLKRGKLEKSYENLAEATFKNLIGLVAKDKDNINIVNVATVKDLAFTETNKKGLIL